MDGVRAQSKLTPCSDTTDTAIFSLFTSEFPVKAIITDTILAENQNVITGTETYEISDKYLLYDSVIVEECYSDSDIEDSLQDKE